MEKFNGRIFVVGDSTVCNYPVPDRIYLPRCGYGAQLYNYFEAEKEQIVNLALSGRSSLNFLTDKSGNYSKLIEEISAGDYLIIGFGHNDEKREDPARYTDPCKSMDDADVEGGASFKYILYEKYIKIAKAAGATPILCTPIVRYDSSCEYVGTSVHETAAGDYAQAIRSLGADTGTQVVDLTSLTRKIYLSDNAAAAYFHSHATYADEESKAPAGMDGTHLNAFGAKRVAYEFAAAISRSGCSLKNYVKRNIAPPQFPKDFAEAVWAEYKKPAYAPFDPAHTAAEELAPGWYATAFGDLGGNGFSPFGVTFKNGVFSVWSDPGQTKGKIAPSGDGIAAAFTAVPVTKNFTASARARLLEAGGGADGQSGFGLMLRDDIYVNRLDVAAVSDYVVSGVLGYPEGNAVFFREGGKLNRADNPVTLSAGSELCLKLVREGQIITAEVTAEGKTCKRQFFDFKLDSVDGRFAYLCLFAARSLKVEFSDLKLELTGDFSGA